MCQIWGVQKTHLLMPWQICFFFTMDEKDFEWEMFLTTSKAGRKRNYPKIKPFWDKGNLFAQFETAEFGVSLISMCRLT
jgi:hypothetical protein